MFFVGHEGDGVNNVYYRRGPLYNFIMKITTKMGDKGETSLFGGRRVGKASRIIDVIGELDELQAVVGWCGVWAAPEATQVGVVTSRRLRIKKILAVVEDDLYRIMSIVGFEFKCPKNIKPIDEEDIERLEKEIEKYEKWWEWKENGRENGTARRRRAFVRPGKSEISARLHIARTVCRRAERGMAGQKPAVPVFILKYLNRLSDLLFIMACAA